MRKSLVFILSLVLVAGFGSLAFAGHATDEGFEYTPSLVKAASSQIDISGSIRVRGEFKDNTYDFDSESADYYADYDSRARLKVKATVSPNTYGVIELETSGWEGGDSYTWGGWDEADGTYSDIGSSSDTTAGNYKPAIMTVRQAYIAHQGTELLGVLSGIKAGHILTKLGNGVFYNHAKFGDDAVVLWVEPQKGTEVSLTMAKLGENSNPASGAAGTSIGGNGNDDVTMYTLGLATGAGGANLAANITYIDDQDFNQNFATGDSKGLHLWNLGFTADTEVNGVSLYGDVEIQSGKAKTAVSGESDMKYKGYAWVIGAEADIPDSPVAVGAEVGYGSGDKIEDSASSIDSGNKNEGFLTTIGTSGNLGIRQTAFLYDDKIANAACNNSTGVTCGKAGLSNVWYINVGADADVTPDLNAALDIFYLRAAKGVAINGATNSDFSAKRSKAIGTEVDAKVTYQVDTNLVYYVEAGYLFAGSAYDNDTVTPGENESADNPYGVRHGLALSF